MQQRYVLEKKNEVPQNFRRLLSSRLRRLVAQEKLEKFQNCFKIKSDSSGEDKSTTAPKNRMMHRWPQTPQNRMMSNLRNCRVMLISLELLILKNYGNWDWYMVGVRCCNKEN
ncbi:hypothetical protein ABKV19_014576 [Rosa sericea]